MNVLFALERTLAERRTANAERRAQRRALHIAMMRFAKLHPMWHEALFDEAFVRHVFARAEGGVDPVTLAREWTRQFRYRDARKREREVCQLVPVAESYLRLLEEAWDEVAPERDRSSRRTPAGGRTEAAPC